MSKLTYQQRGNQNTRIPVGQKRTAGGKVLEDNRAAFAAKQLKQGETAQLTKEEDELLKGKSGTKQLAKKDEEEIGQAKFSDRGPPVQREEQPAKPNSTGLPDKLKNGIESLSGLSMDSVKVHYNSAKPQQLNALAYAQYTDIHVGAGQEQHLPHEAWHVVQQAQGRVKPTMQMKGGVSVNDDKGLEQEADINGRKAASGETQAQKKSTLNPPMEAIQRQITASSIIQRAVIPVYLKNPPDEPTRKKDKDEVDQFAENSKLGSNAGDIKSDFKTGGSLAGISAPEKIILTGHGNVGTLNGYSASEVANGLISTWGLPKEYTGVLHLSSCKAGDSGYFSYLSPSLVAGVSDSLFGYQATVEGLKGNVVTGVSLSTRPGVDRSVGDNEAFESYKRLEQQYRDLKKRRDTEFSNGEGGLSELSAKSCQIKLQMMQMELKRLESAATTPSSLLSSLGSILSIGATKLELLVQQIELQQLEVTKHEQAAKSERDRIGLKYKGALDEILNQIDSLGIPFGDESVTVRHGPADRNTLANQWVDFLLKESEL